jgi:hypothetical protein
VSRANQNIKKTATISGCCSVLYSLNHSKWGSLRRYWRVWRNNVGIFCLCVLTKIIIAILYFKFFKPRQTPKKTKELAMKFCVENRVSVLRTDSASTHIITLFIRFYCFAKAMTDAKDACRAIFKKTHKNHEGGEHETRFTIKTTSVKLLDDGDKSNDLVVVYQAEGKKESTVYGSTDHSGSNKHLHWTRISSKAVDYTY